MGLKPEKFLQVQSLQKNKKYGKLSGRKKEIISLPANGFGVKEISTRLNISFYAVSKHAHYFYVKLGVQSRTQAVNKVLKR